MTHKDIIIFSEQYFSLPRRKKVAFVVYFTTSICYKISTIKHLIFYRTFHSIDMTFLVKTDSKFLSPKIWYVYTKIWLAIEKPSKLFMFQFVGKSSIFSFEWKMMVFLSHIQEKWKKKTKKNLLGAKEFNKSSQENLLCM